MRHVLMCGRTAARRDRIDKTALERLRLTTEH
jgi:hypothetical protein